MTGNLGKAARNSFLVVLVTAGLVSLAVPYRIITARIQEMARDRISSGRDVSPAVCRVAAIAELKVFVEGARGLEFRHDVPVVLEPAEKFRKRLEAEATEYGDFDVADAYVALKALHLVDRRLDLGTLEDLMQDARSLGYYDPYANRLSCRETA